MPQAVRDCPLTPTGQRVLGTQVVYPSSCTPFLDHPIHRPRILELLVQGPVRHFLIPWLWWMCFFISFPVEIRQGMSFIRNTFILNNMKQFYLALLCYIKLIYIYLNLYIICLYLIVPPDINKPLKQHFVRNDTALMCSLWVRILTTPDKWQSSFNPSIFIYAGCARTCGRR